MKKSKDYCGIVFIGAGGSAWAWAATPEEAAQQAAKECKRSWKHFYKFKRKQEFKVCIYDMTQHEGWYADYRGVFDQDTKELIELHSVITAVA
jgi:hypothetical protein